MFTQGMEQSRETLSEHLTGLKSLLRLNADGIGDDEDLTTQLNRTRLALDKFEGDLLGHQHIVRGDVITPDTLPPSSRASAIAEEDLDREGGSPYFSRPTTATSMTSVRFSLDSLPSSWKHSSNSHVLVSSRNSLSKKSFAFMEDVEDMGEEGGERVVEHQEGAEAEEETIHNDVAFQRLSMLLAGLQAQAEAAVSSPTSLLQQLGSLDPPVELDEQPEEETLFPGMSRSTSSSMTTITDNTVGANASTPGTPRLVSSFHRTSSLPFIAPRPSRRTSKINFDKSENAINPFAIPSPQAASLSPMSPSTTSPSFELPLTPPPTLRRRPIGLDLPSQKTGISSAFASPVANSKPAITSTLPSPTLLARHGSYLVTDTDFESLLNEFLEMAQMRNREGAYDVMFRGVWIYLLGGGVVWAAVGWMLGWGCRECNSCVAVSS